METWSVTWGCLEYLGLLKEMVNLWMSPCLGKGRKHLLEFWVMDVTTELF